MRLRRGAVALATLLVLAAGATPLLPVPASAGSGGHVVIQSIQTSAIKVGGGYRMTVSVQRSIDDAGTSTFLAIDIVRQEPTGGTSTLVQAHEWGWKLPKAAFHVHRDLSHGWIDTGDRMGAFGHLRMHFASTGPVDVGGCAEARRGTLSGNTRTAFVLRADAGYFGTIKARSFRAQALQFTDCSGARPGGGGGCHISPGVAAIVPSLPMFRGTRAAQMLRHGSDAMADASAQPGSLVRRALASPTPRQFAIFQRSPRGFNFLEFVTGQRHVAHVMVLFTTKPFLTGGVTATATDLTIVPPADTTTWLGGTETITGPGDPTGADRTCKGHVLRARSDDSATTAAGGGGAFTAHFDSMGDVAMQDGLSSSVRQVRRVS